MTDTPRPLRNTALRRLKDTFKSNDLLLPMIERHVMRQMDGDPRPADHSMEYMHPSDMSKSEWCGRHDYYRMKGTPIERKAARNPSFRMSNVFAEGHAIGAKWTGWLWEMGVLVGDFRCRECHHRWYDKSPMACQFCRSERLQYMEYPMRRERYMVEGHADAAIHLEDDRALVEVKSIGIQSLRFEAPRLYNRYLQGEKAEDVWLSINHPFASHMRQGQLYLWMAWPLYEQIVFIYESKFTQQTKEFVVEYNKAHIAAILATAKDVAQGYRAGIVPERPSWVSGPDGKICTSCEYRRTCWSVDDDSPNEETTAAARILRGTSSKRRRALRATAVHPAPDS